MRVMLTFFMLPLIVQAEPRKLQVQQSVPVQSAVITQLVPIVVQVPAYSVSYQPLQDKDPILEELRMIRALLAGRNGAALQGPALLRQSCIGCHGAVGAPNKGGGFVIVDAQDKLMPFSLPERRRMMDLIQQDVMPKNRKLTENEKKTLIAFLKGETP